MIEVADGYAVERLIRRAVNNGARYRRLVVCAPFIDACWLALFGLHGGGCDITVVTTPAAAAHLRATNKCTGITIATHPGLHAKIYLLEGHRLENSEVIVTSANLTNSGLRGNTELGTRAIPTTAAGRALYTEIVRQMRSTGLTGSMTRRAV